MLVKFWNCSHIVKTLAPGNKSYFLYCNVAWEWKFKKGLQQIHERKSLNINQNHSASIRIIQQQSTSIVLDLCLSNVVKFLLKYLLPAMTLRWGRVWGGKAIDLGMTSQQQRPRHHCPMTLPWSICNTITNMTNTNTICNTTTYQYSPSSHSRKKAGSRDPGLDPMIFSGKIRKNRKIRKNTL